MIEDTELLRRYSESCADDAFAELVQRRIGLVYAVAYRQTRDAHRAEDVAQEVFTDLARKAGVLSRHPVLIGWLYRSAHFAAMNVVRAEQSRTKREKEAHTMQEISSGDDLNREWERVRPVLDELMSELNEQDRDAILLRFFDNRPFADIGVRLKLSENAARMRVDRALEKLRTRLTRRGITTTVAALGAVMANQPAVAAPAELAAAVSASSVARAAIRNAGLVATWNALDFMTKLKIALAAATVFTTTGAGTYLIAQQTGAASPPAATTDSSTALAGLQAENQNLKAEVARLQKAVSDSAPSPLAELRALVLAKQQKVLQPLRTLVKLNQDQWPAGLVTLFNLTPDEKTAVDKTFAKANDELVALEAANVASVDRPSATTVVIRFKLFPDAGGKVHDTFAGELSQTLGTERFAALQTLMGDGFDWTLGGGFGAVEHSLTVERRTVGQINDETAKLTPLPGAPTTERKTVTLLNSQAFTYEINDRSQWPPTGKAQLAIVNISNAGFRTALNQKYPWLAKLLPDDF